VIVLAPRDALFDKTVSNMQEVMARDGKVWLITDADGARRRRRRLGHPDPARGRPGLRADPLRRSGAADRLSHGAAQGHGCGPAAQPREIRDGGMTPNQSAVDIAAAEDHADLFPGHRASFSCISPASGAAPAPSARLWVQRKEARIASATSSSLTLTIRAAPFGIDVEGRLHRHPHRHAVGEGGAALSVSTSRPASTERFAQSAFSDTTPTIFVFNPKALRAAISPQMPEPQPIGT
jgi:hypothetical protein